METNREFVGHLLVGPTRLRSKVGSANPTTETTEPFEGAQLTSFQATG